MCVLTKTILFRYKQLFNIFLCNKYSKEMCVLTKTILFRYKQLFNIFLCNKYSKEMCVLTKTGTSNILLIKKQY